MRVGVGRRMTISISKIRNRTARRKNRNENGIRAFEDGEKPHSNGLEVSRFNHGVMVFVPIDDKANLISIGNKVASKMLMVIVIIYL